MHVITCDLHVGWMQERQRIVNAMTLNGDNYQMAAHIPWAVCTSQTDKEVRKEWMIPWPLSGPSFFG
jgi:hypothetical protein